MNSNDNTNLLNIASVATEYCATLQRTVEMEKREFVETMLRLLPTLYLEFTRIPAENPEEAVYLTEHIDEDYYAEIRHSVEMLLGEDDTYLETFEQDMKFSDTPIAATISEGLADIFQDLFNFVEEVRLSEGDQLRAAYDACKENFEMYWSATLCNVMRPLNHIRYHSLDSEENN